MHNGSIGGLIVPLTAEEKSTLEQIKVLKSEIQGLEPQLEGGLSVNPNRK